MSMFSSFAQFLPSAIQNTLASHSPPPANAPEADELPPRSHFDPSTDDEGDEEELIRQHSLQLDEQQDKHRVKSKKEKDLVKSVSETFIFVRPPPSKTNHPLNLQVQLVPPTARAPSGVSVSGNEPTTPRSASSTASSTSIGGAAFSRSTSTHSEYSSTFASGSTASFASVESGTSSGTSSSSSRSARRIIPLYNLQAHNVLTNVIADAGTDAKIAKFQKKGLEMIDLAVLEPVEVWGVRNRSGEKEARKQGMRISVDETGSIVHAGEGPTTGGHTRAKNGRTGSGLLHPKSSRSDDITRSATPSASSSALSLNSNSTHFSNQPQFVISPPHQSMRPPGSAPPHSGTFPSVHPQKPDNAIPSPLPCTDVSVCRDPQSYWISSSTTPSKKATAGGGLFGKLKFGTRRNSTVGLSSSPDALTVSSPTSPLHPQHHDYPSEFAEFAMAPLAPGELHPRFAHKATTSGFQKPPSLVSPPNSPTSVNSQSSNTPTPTLTKPNPNERRYRNDDDDNLSSPTPTVLSQKPAFISSLEKSPSSSQQIKNVVSLGGALSRGRSKFISGIKTAATAPLVGERGSVPAPIPLASPTQAAGGSAKGFFNKIAAGISGGDRPTRGFLGPRGDADDDDDGVSRDIADSMASPSSGKGSSPFGRLLHRSSSQQFIGKAPTSSGSTSANPSPRPSHEMMFGPQQQMLSPTSSSSNLSPTPALQQSFLPQQVGASGSSQNLQLHQLSLRQLQLRPPVLGIQPTYVSASQAYASHHPSSLSLEEGVGDSANVSVNGNHGGVPLTKVESFSSLGAGTEESVELSSSNRRRSRTRKEGSARGSLDLDRESFAARSTTVLAPPKGKERALMYVWLVGRWLKKRGTGAGMTTEHGQSASEASGMGRGARDLLHNILPGRDKGGNNGLAPSEPEVNRRSWQAGSGTGLIPSLSVLSGLHAQQLLSSSSHPQLGQLGKPLVLGTMVGGGFEVRFEWKRAKTKRTSRKNKDDAEGNQRGRKKEKEKEKEAKSVPEVTVRDMLKGGNVDNDDTPRIPQGPMVDTSPRKMTLDERKRQNRSSIASMSSLGDDRDSGSLGGGSVSPSRRSTTASRKNRLSLILKRNKDDVDDEEGSGTRENDDDSDSEDSETPWVCTLKIRRVARIPQQGGSGVSVLAVDIESGGRDQSLRLKVGTLSPTPHHPKVVSMLKVPFPLPDVEVERMEIVRKKGLPNSNSIEKVEEAKEPYFGLTLTAEDIKDIVCSTGLWLVVREGFGGVGKVSRKGDGWRIRG